MCNTSEYARVYGGVVARDVTHLQELFEKELLVYQIAQRQALTQLQYACRETANSSECGEQVVLSYQKQVRAMQAAVSACFRCRR